MIIYCYYNSDTSKKVMPQIILGELLQKGGASTEYISCISVNVQKGEGLPPSTCGVSV